jgi:K+-sensing histidine kinase KdpD
MSDTRFPHRILACIPASRSADAELKAAAALAGRLEGTLLAGHVTAPGFGGRSRPVGQALSKNIALAEKLGATVITIEADDVAVGLIAMAQREGVTHAMFGHRGDPSALFAKGSIVATFAGASRGVEIQVIGVPLEARLLSGEWS